MEALFSKIDTLKQDHLAGFDHNRQIHTDWLEALFAQFCQTLPDKNPLWTAARYLQMFAGQYPVTIQENEWIVGTDYHWNALRRSLDVPLKNMGHFTADYAEVLRCGISGLRQKVDRLQSGNETVCANQAAFCAVLDAFSLYIWRYAQKAKRLSEEAVGEEKQRLAEISRDCLLLSEEPPKTFRQALQLVWFTQIFLETEAISAAVSFGRMDCYLYSYYERDLAAGILTEDEALRLIMCFYIKTCEGDESQMVTLGGPGENRLTVLFLKAQAYLNMRQPSICLRVYSGTTEAVWRAAEALAATGNGMPAYFNDDVLIHGLTDIGVDGKSAADYGVVGCYEAAPQGSYSNTVALAYHIYDSFAAFLAKKQEYADYEAFLTAYKAFFAEFYTGTLLPRMRKRLKQIRSWRSPFLACCLKGCLESGYLPEQFGAEYTLFGLNGLEMGVLIDSIYTVKKLVFETKQITLRELCDQAANNFECHDLLAKIKALDGAFGADAPETNVLAEELSDWIATVIRENPLHQSVLVSPGLFWFTADIKQREYPATLNGRRKGELLSYGVSPCATPHTHPTTSLLLSAAHVRTDRFPNGCPLMLSLPLREGTNQIQSLVKTYFASGGFHLAVNGVDAAVLEKALKSPEEYRHIMVKISGFSAKYVRLSRELQQAILERVRNGM